MTRTLLHASRFLFSASIAIALTACATNSQNGVPGAGNAPQVPTTTQTIVNDSGDYSGSFQDSALGAGSASASLAQDGQVVGGVINVAYGSNNVSYSVAEQTQDGLSIGGAQVAELAGGVCSLRFPRRTTKNKRPVGNVQERQRMRPVTGLFSLQHECVFKRAGLLDIVSAESRSASMNPDHGPQPC